MLCTDSNFFKHPNVIEFVNLIRHEFNNAHRPANEVILNEEEFCAMLKISKRHASDLRKEGRVAYSKKGGMIYYLLSDVLEYIERDRVPVVSSKFKN